MRSPRTPATLALIVGMATLVGCAAPASVKGPSLAGLTNDKTRVIEPLSLDLEPGADLAGLLDRALARDGMRGALLGQITGTGRSHPLMPGDPQDRVVTDYDLRVDELLGAGQLGFKAGETITLRIPGGQTSDGQNLAYEDAPELRLDDFVGAFVQDQPNDGPAGSQGEKTLVVSTANNFAVIKDGQAVFKRGNAAVSEVRRRLNEHPARS